MTLFFPANASSITYEFGFFANSRASKTTKLDGMDSWYMRKHGYNVFLRMYLSVVVSVPHSQVRIMFGQCWYGLRGPCHWFRSCQEHLHHLVLFVSHLYFTNRYVRMIFLGDFSQHYTKKLHVPPVCEKWDAGALLACVEWDAHTEKIKPAIGLPRRILSFGTFMWLQVVHIVQIGRPRFLVKLNDHCPLCVQTGPAIVDANFCPPPPWTQNVVVVVNYLIWWRYFYCSWT